MNLIYSDLSDNAYLAGYTDSFGAGDFDMVLVKYDSSGVQQWNRTWGGIDTDFSMGVVSAAKTTIGHLRKIRCIHTRIIR